MRSQRYLRGGLQAHQQRVDKAFESLGFRQQRAEYHGQHAAHRKAGHRIEQRGADMRPQRAR